MLYASLPKTTQGDRNIMKECCKSAINRVEIRTEREDITVHQCVACGRKHYRMQAEPGLFGALFSKAGQ